MEPLNGNDEQGRWRRRYWDSVARVAQLTRGTDRAFVARVLWEAAHVLRDEVTFATALIRCEGGSFTVEAVYRPEAAGVAMPERGAQFPLHGGALGEIMRTGRTYMVPDAKLAGAAAPRALRAFVFAPIRFESLAYALVIAATRTPALPFDEEDRAYVDALAGLCAARLQQRRAASSDEFARAVAADELELYFQPQVHLPSGRLTGAEALIRWNRLGHGTLSASDFIPVAEEHGLLGAVGAWVVHEAAFAAKQLQTIDPLFRIWFHLSSGELADPRVMRAIEQAGAALHGLGVEIREHAVVVDEHGASCAFVALKDAGLAVALDNFGGSSSLLRLRTLPLDVVKLDRSLTAELPHSRADRDIVEAVIELGRRFRFETAAEAVETDEQAAWLRNAGCAFAQGHRFGRPMRAQELKALMVTRSMIDGRVAVSRLLAH
jgi:EAL domain-containing protein (putative c-di-GMP-specific phosphodiesterase class I)